MQSADKYYFNYLAKFIADNRYYRDNFENIIDYRDKKNCTDNGNPNLEVCRRSVSNWSTDWPIS